MKTQTFAVLDLVKIKKYTDVPHIGQIMEVFPDGQYDVEVYDPAIEKYTVIKLSSGFLTPYVAN